jgi:rubredoxin
MKPDYAPEMPDPDHDLEPDKTHENAPMHMNARHKAA